MVHAWRITGLLDVHAEINHVHDYLRVAHGLEIAAHHAERHERLAVFGHKRRNDGLERTFARRVGVGVRGIEVEQFAPVLEHEAQPVGNHAAAHAPVVALDQRNHVTILVGGGQVNCFTGKRVARHKIVARPVGVDQFAAFGGVGFGNQFLHGHFHKFRVGVVLGAVFKSEFLGLRKQVYVPRRAEVLFPEFKTLQNVQYLQHIDSLAVGRQFPDIITPVVRRNRFNPLRTVAGKVFIG